MKIGIDIDDTITNTGEQLLEYLGQYGGHIDFDDPKNNKIDILRGKLVTDEVIEFIKNYGSEIAEKADVKSNAADVISRLKNDGHEIHIVTSRREKYMPSISEITRKYLKRNGIFFDKLHMEVFDKKAFCLENRIDVMIDDSTEICEDLLSTDIKPILFTTVTNEAIKTKVVRVGNWLQLETNLLKLVYNKPLNS